MSQSKNALQQLQAQFSQEREHLAQQMQELALEHQHRQCRLQEVHCCALQDMDDAQQMELRVSAPYASARPNARTYKQTCARHSHIHEAAYKLSDAGENPRVTLESILRQHPVTD